MGREEPLHGVGGALCLAGYWEYWPPASYIPLCPFFLFLGPTFPFPHVPELRLCARTLLKNSYPRSSTSSICLSGRASSASPLPCYFPTFPPPAPGAPQPRFFSPSTIAVVHILPPTRITGSTPVIAPHRFLRASADTCRCALLFVNLPSPPWVAERSRSKPSRMTGTVLCKYYRARRVIFATWH